MLKSERNILAITLAGLDIIISAFKNADNNTDNLKNNLHTAQVK